MPTVTFTHNRISLGQSAASSFSAYDLEHSFEIEAEIVNDGDAQWANLLTVLCTETHHLESGSVSFPKVELYQDTAPRRLWEDLILAAIEDCNS